MQVGDLWKSYCRKIETDPVKTKAITSFLGFMIGDSIAQKVEGHTFNPIRSVPVGISLHDAFPTLSQDNSWQPQIISGAYKGLSFLCWTLLAQCMSRDCA